MGRGLIEGSFGYPLLLTDEVVGVTGDDDGGAVLAARNVTSDY